MPFRSSSLQDRIMDTNPRSSSSSSRQKYPFLPFTSQTTTRLPPTPLSLPNPELRKTKWSQHWLSATYPAVWSSKTKSSPIERNSSVDEGLLSQVVEMENEEGRFGRGEREKKVRRRQVAEIAVLFGVGILLVGLVVVCVSAGGMMRGAKGLGVGGWGKVAGSDEVDGLEAYFEDRNLLGEFRKEYVGPGRVSGSQRGGVREA